MGDESTACVPTPPRAGWILNFRVLSLPPPLLCRHQRPRRVVSHSTSLGRAVPRLSQRDQIINPIHLRFKSRNLHKNYSGKKECVNRWLHARDKSGRNGMNAGGAKIQVATRAAKQTQLWMTTIWMTWMTRSASTSVHRRRD